MWNMIMERIPSLFVMILAILSALLPWGIYKFNQTLHKYADPPWKKEEKNE